MLGPRTELHIPKSKSKISKFSSLFFPFLHVLYANELFLSLHRSRGPGRGSSRLSARRVSEAKKTSIRSNPHKGERLRHAFPRHCRDKQWEVRDIGRISVGEDGSLDCELLWLPTTVSISTLNGALLERAEELVKQDHSAEIWDKWLEIQGEARRRRCRVKGGNSQRQK